MRLQHEAAYWDPLQTTFYTFTYSPEYLLDNSLHKRDLTLFFKRLRKWKYPNRIKYFACGEYGEKQKRPHYHAILYGVFYDDKSKVESLWQKGFSYPGFFSPQSAKYVANYVLKSNSQSYASSALEKPFLCVSQGIGKQFCLDHKDQLISDGCIYHNGKERNLPHYYIKKLSENDESIAADLLEKASKRGEEALDKLREHYFAKYPDKKIIWERVQASRAQSEKNIQAKLKLKAGIL